MSLLNVGVFSTRLNALLTNSLAGLLLLTLAACDSVEERVVEHYERGLALLEEGVPQKAILEFSNALQLDENHAPSHFAIGQIYETRGEAQQAFARYLKAADLDPNHAEARLKLARFYLLSNETDKSREELNAVLKLSLDTAEVHALAATIAIRDGDMTAAKTAIERAYAIAPGNPEVALVDIGYLSQEVSLTAALARTDEALAEHNDNLPLHLMKLRMLEQAGDQKAIGAQLAAMIETFPEESGLREARVRWALQNENMDVAEAELRALVNANPGDRESIVNLIRFLRQRKNDDDARSELVSLIGSATEPFPIEMLLAQFDIQTGREEAAISYLRDLVGRAGNNANQVRVVLAQLLIARGETEEAHSLVEKTLAEDPDDTEALVLQTVRLIEDERHDEAIQVVRKALGGAPDDERLLMLAARAQELSGNINLASDRLAKAVRVSEYQPNIVERYVNFLQRTNRNSAAETILSEAIKRHAENSNLLDRLASIRLQLQDWRGADNAIASLAKLDAERSRQLKAVLLINQEKFAEGAELLKDLPSNRGQRDASILALVQTYRQNGQNEDAKAFLEGLLVENPKNLQALGLQGAIFASENNARAAEDNFNKILEIDPGNEGAILALARLRQSAGDTNGAAAILAAGLEASPNSLSLKVRLAQQREVDGDLQKAIELYNQAYRQAPDNLLVINNLASLLSDQRAGPARDIDLAYRIAGRLRNADVPHFRDTYGWTRYLKKENAEALEHLQFAAEALPENPWVRFHLGMTLVALKQPGKAREHLEAALELSEGMEFPQGTEVREALAKLE